MVYEECNCIDRRRVVRYFFTNHHPDCEKYDPELDCYNILKPHLEHLEAWARNEGIRFSPEVSLTIQMASLCVRYRFPKELLDLDSK